MYEPNASRTESIEYKCAAECCSLLCARRAGRQAPKTDLVSCLNVLQPLMSADPRMRTHRLTGDRTHALHSWRPLCSRRQHILYTSEGKSRFIYIFGGSAIRTQPRLRHRMCVRSYSCPNRTEPKTEATFQFSRKPHSLRFNEIRTGISCAAQANDDGANYLHMFHVFHLAQSQIY